MNSQNWLKMPGPLFIWLGLLLLTKIPRGLDPLFLTVVFSGASFVAFHFGLSLLIRSIIEELQAKEPKVQTEPLPNFLPRPR